jgi:hypothetical protein
MKPRKWLGYTVLLNDLIERSDEIIDRFELSEIPLSDTFGSSSDPPIKPSRYILLVGPGVEIERVKDVLKLLEGMEPDYILPEIDGAYRKHIYIGCNDSDSEPIIPLSSELKKKIMNKKNQKPFEIKDFLLNY